MFKYVFFASIFIHACRFQRKYECHILFIVRHSQNFLEITGRNDITTDTFNVFQTQNQMDGTPVD